MLYTLCWWANMFSCHQKEQLNINS